MDRRTLPLGIVLIAVGLYFVLSRTFRFSGPGAVLLLIGAIFLALSAARGFRGPLLPGGILLGLGSAFLLQGRLDPVFPRWAVIILGIGAGFLLVAAIDRASGRERRPSPLLPGVALVGVAAIGALAQRTPIFEVFSGLGKYWPWALVIAGALLVGQALLRSRRV
jgi:drug/metabolite transporter (DMT)-like permease